MVETIVALLCAHFIADFILQTNWILDRKKNLAILTLHIAIVVSLSAMLLGAFHLPILALIAVTHFAADYIKTNYYKDDFEPFLVDQAIHIAVIINAGLLFPNAFANGLWPAAFQEATPLYLSGAALMAGFILCVPAGGVFIAKLMKPLSDQLEESAARAGLENGGKYIGWLERSLVFLLVLTQNIAGIGFLITAKSILRIGEIKDGADRKLAEYIIIGTFLSFGWALLAAHLAFAALRLW